jgi:non-heme chloroperoxidase
MTDVTSFDGTRWATTYWGPPDAPIVLLVQSGDAQSGGHAMSAHAGDLGAVIDTLVAPDERAVVVAHSLGGGVLLAHVDAAGDERIAGAVFAGSGGSARRHPPPFRLSAFPHSSSTVGLIRRSPTAKCKS